MHVRERRRGERGQNSPHTEQECLAGPLQPERRRPRQQDAAAPVSVPETLGSVTAADHEIIRHGANTVLLIKGRRP